MSEKIRIFTSEFCPPCQELKNKLTPEELKKIEWVDIHTDKGYEEAMSRRILGVPSAIKNGRMCRILYNHNGVEFDCGEKNAKTLL